VVISSARSSVCARISSYHLRSTVARSFAGFARHAGSARCAASIARRVSAAPMSVTSTIFSPVAGSLTAKRPPASASTHLPSM